MKPQPQKPEFGAFALALGRSKGNFLSGVEFSKGYRARFPGVELILRAAVNAGTTSDPNWAASLVEYGTMQQMFLESLRSISAFDVIFPSARRAPARASVTAVSIAITGSRIGEGKPKTVSRLSLTAAEAVPGQKQVALIVVSDALLRMASDAGAQLLNQELIRAVSAVTNLAFVEDMIDGITPVTSSGATAASVLADIGALLAQVPTGATSALFLLLSAETAKQIATLATNDGAQAFPAMTPSGGTLCGVRVIVSDEVPDGSIVLIDADQIVVDDGPITLDQATSATLQMDDAPAEGASNLVSLFQTDSIALRAERWASWKRLRQSAVAVVTGADYTGTP